MKKIKLFETFIEDKKYHLNLNESLFDKIESLVKGKSDKGEVVSKLLQTNGIKEAGTVYGIWYVGGSEPGKKEKSNPIDYISFASGVAKVEDGKVVLTDDKSKKLKVHDTIPFLISMEGKDQVNKNFSFGLKPGTVVWKCDYEFDLASDKPTLTLEEKQVWSIPSQKWIAMDDRFGGGELNKIELSDDLGDLDETAIFSFKTPLKEITLEEWVEKLNSTGWVEKDPEYFSDTLKIS